MGITIFKCKCWEIGVSIKPKGHKLGDVYASVWMGGVRDLSIIRRPGCMFDLQIE